MNPNGLFTPKAQDAARKQYLSNLKLQQANIDYNLNERTVKCCDIFEHLFTKQL